MKCGSLRVGREPARAIPRYNRVLDWRGEEPLLFDPWWGEKYMASQLQEGTLPFGNAVKLTDM